MSKGTLRLVLLVLGIFLAYLSLLVPLLIFSRFWKANMGYFTNMFNDQIFAHFVFLSDKSMKGELLDEKAMVAEK